MRAAHRVFLFPVLLFIALPATAQTGPNVQLDASPQIFAVLCAARAAGVNAPAGSGAASQLVDNALARLDPAVAAPLRAYVQARRPQQGGGEELTPYLSAALLMGPPPDFKYIVPREQLPPDVWELEDFPALIRTFYAQAGLGPLWERVRPAYEQAIADRQAGVAQMMLETRGYLRLINENTSGQTYTIYLDWMVPPSLVSARKYGEQYYLILHPQPGDFLAAVRHQYLHFLLDPISTRYAEVYSSWGQLLPLVERAPRLPADFRHDVYLLATESLIQAVELRMRRLPAEQAEKELDAIEHSGYIFARFFFESLTAYERSEPSIRYYFPELVKGFDVSTERSRLERLDFGARASATQHAEAPASDTPRRLLAEAETHLAAGNYAAARQGFERVLREWNPDEPRALYGLALVASAEENRDEAKRYFLLALERARGPRILGWSHVYLGRIYDLEGNRPEAVAQYRAALALDTHLERVEQAARRGLERPFGEAEEPASRQP